MSQGWELSGRAVRGSHKTLFSERCREILDFGRALQKVKGTNIGKALVGQSTGKKRD